MNLVLTSLELAVLALGLGLVLLDLWTPPAMKRSLGYAAAAAIGVIFVFSFSPYFTAEATRHAFGTSYVMDGLALYFKRFFLVAAGLVLVMAVEYSDQIESGISEYYSLIVFALAGMMYASSANDFPMLFVSLELITVSFYILTSFRRNRQASLEAGVKYLILGALSSAFLVYGIALIYGSTGTMSFEALSAKIAATPALLGSVVLRAGALLVFLGLAFKFAAVPFQVWAPDVYQGAPPPTTAFLAVGSKAAGVVLLMRLVGTAIPVAELHWHKLLIVVSALTIIYGSLCAIPQRNLKRLIGYSSIASAGYLLMGFATLSKSGAAAVLYYVTGYLFTVIAAFIVLSIIIRKTDSEDISSVAGLGQRSPMLAAVLTMAMVSLAGVPPLAGFFGKFWLIKALLEQLVGHPKLLWLLAVAIVGVVISLYYYFGVIKAIYWPTENADKTPIEISRPARIAIWICAGGMLWLGLFPGLFVTAANEAVKLLKLS